MAIKTRMKSNIGPPKVKSKTQISAPSELAKGLALARPKAASRVLKQHEKMMKGE